MKFSRFLKASRRNSIDRRMEILRLSQYAIKQPQPNQSHIDRVGILMGAGNPQWGSRGSNVADPIVIANIVKFGFDDLILNEHHDILKMFGGAKIVG